MRSRQISDYFQAPLTDIRPAIPLDFDVHLYFAKNNHIILWQRRGDLPGVHVLVAYRKRGLDAVWIHRSDEESYRAYLARPLIAPPDKPVAEVKSPFSEILSSDSSPEQKTELLAQSARELLQESVTATPRSAVQEAEAKAQLAVQDLLDLVAKEIQRAVADLWRLSTIDETLVHAPTVATYAVLFALADRQNDPRFLGDIALAGLLHDIGLSQIPATVACQPVTRLSQSDRQHFEKHPEIGARLAASWIPDLSYRVRTVIQYQCSSPASPLDVETEQMRRALSMAELLACFSDGRWDGKERTIAESLTALEQLERSRQTPAQFSPELFHSLLDWTRSPEVGKIQESVDGAAAIVHNQASGIMNG